MRRSALPICAATLFALVLTQPVTAASVVEQWRGLPTKVTSCFEIAAEGANTTIAALAAGGVGPNDGRLADLLSACQKYAAGMRQSFDCTLKAPDGSDIQSVCREYYVVMRNGQWTEVAPDEALNLGFLQHENIQIMFTETPAGYAERLKTIEAQLGGDPARDEVDSNDGGATPISPVKPSEDAPDPAPAKAPDASSAAVKDNAKVQPVDASPTSLEQSTNGFVIDGRTARIQDVGLMDGPSSCSPIALEQVGMNLLGEFTPTGMMYMCKKGSPPDSTIVYFNRDQSSVIKIRRTLYIDEKNNDVKAVLQAAKDFYGTPKVYDPGNWLLGYGNSFAVTYNVRRANVRELETGTGLLIKGEACSEVQCPDGYSLRLVFTLVDNAAFALAEREGKLLLKEQKLGAGAATKF